MLDPVWLSLKIVEKYTHILKSESVYTQNLRTQNDTIIFVYLSMKKVNVQNIMVNLGLKPKIYNLQYRLNVQFNAVIC